MDNINLTEEQAAAFAQAIGNETQAQPQDTQPEAATGAQGQEGQAEQGTQQEAERPSWLEEVGKRLGKQIESEDDFLSIVNQKPQAPELPEKVKAFYKEGKLELPKAVEELLDVAQASPEAVKEYFRLRSTDPESLDGRENEKLAYVRENLAKYGGDKALVEALFEKDYRTKYPELSKLEKMKATGADQDEIAEFEAENAEEIVLQRKLREHSEAVAKKTNSEWLQTQVSSFVQGQGKPLSKEEAEAMQQELVRSHNESVQKAMSGYKGYDIGGFAIGLDEKAKQALAQKAAEFLPHLEEQYGFDLANGTIKDYNKFIQKLHKDLTGDTFAGEAYKKWVLEQNREETLRGQRENPGTRQANGTFTAPSAEAELEAELARAFRNKLGT